MTVGGCGGGRGGGVDGKLFLFCSYRPEELLARRRGSRGARGGRAIKNVVQGRRLKGGSPWLLFFVLSTLAPPPPLRHGSLSLCLPLPLPPSHPPSRSLIFFLPLALYGDVVGADFTPALYFRVPLRSFLLDGLALSAMLPFFLSKTRDRKLDDSRLHDAGLS